MSTERQLTRRGFFRAAATAAAGSLVACLPRSTAIPTPESQSTPVPTPVLPTEIPFAPEPPVDLTAEAIKRTTLDSNLTDVSGDVLLQGMGGKEAPGFGKPIITESLTATEIEAARALLGQKNAGTLYAVENGKAVIQRIIGVDPVTGIDYSTETDESKVPFRVTVTMLPNSFLQADGERRILPEKTKPGEARYLKTNDQTEWNVTSTFLIDPGFLPTGAAFWWDMSGMNLRPVMWDGNGNPRLMENIPVDVKLATIEPTPTPTPTEVPKQETITFDLTDGTTLEMPQFQIAEEALEYVEKNTLWWTGNVAVRSTVGHTWNNDETPEDLTFSSNTRKLPGIGMVFGREILFTFPATGDSFFPMGVYKVNEGKTLLVFRNNARQREVVCVDMNSTEFVPWLSKFPYSTPTPEP